MFKRYTVEFSQEAEDILTWAKVELKLSSNSEVIQKALNLLNFVLEEQRKGNHIIIESQDGSSRREIS